MAEQENFIKERQQALEQMLEMSRRSKGDGIRVPHFVQLPEQNTPKPKENSFKAAEQPPPTENHPRNKGNRPLGGLSLPFFENFKLDRDTTLILGLLLLLYSEKSDRYLLLALLYILL